MSDFSQKLGSLIRGNNISIYGLAKNMDCNRTWLQKVISGDRNIDFENFIKLGRELLKHIDENSYLELYEIFAENYFGAKEFGVLKYIQNRLLDTLRLENVLDDMNSGFDIDKFIKFYNLSNNEAKILREVNDLVISEIRESITKDIKSIIYVKIPCEFAFLRNYFISFIYKNSDKVDIDFIYVICSNNGENYSIRYIENFITASEFASYGINVIYDDKFTNNLDSKCLFPYYIITRSDSIMISSDGQVTIHNDEKMEIVLNKFLESYSSMNKFIKYINSSEISSILYNISDEEFEFSYDLRCGVFLPEFFDRDMAENIIKTLGVEEFFMVDSLFRFCEKCKENRLDAFGTIESIRKFMNSTEKVAYNHYEIILTKSDKIKILDNIYRYYANTDAEFHILKTGEKMESSRLHIMGWNNRTVCSMNRIHKKNETIDGFGFVLSPSLSSHIRNYCMYIQHSGIFLNKNISLEMLGNLIESYKNI